MQDFVLPLVIWRYRLPLLSALASKSCGEGLQYSVKWLRLVGCAENPRNGECARVEMSCGERSDEGSKVGPAHRKVAGEGLVEDLIKLSLN